MSNNLLKTKLTILGLDVGGSKTAIVEGTRDAEILQRYELATEAWRPFVEVFPRIAALMQRVIDEAAQQQRTITAVSVSIGGPLRIAEGVLLDPPHLPGWHGVALKARLAAAFPHYSLFSLSTMATLVR
jgi:glucokinase